MHDDAVDQLRKSIINIYSLVPDEPLQMYQWLRDTLHKIELISAQAEKNMEGEK